MWTSTAANRTSYPNMNIVPVVDNTHGVPCFRYRVNGHEALSAALVAQAYEQRSRRPAGVNYGGYAGETTWHSPLQAHDGACAELIALADEVVSLRWAAVGWSRQSHPWRVVYLWANIGAPGDFTLGHHHLAHGGKAVFGGTYYAQVPAGGGNFLACSPDAGLEAWGGMRPADYAPFEVPRWWSVEPQTGDVLLFPGWVQHAVAPNRSQQDRIAWTFLCEMDLPLEVDVRRDRPEYRPLSRHPGWLGLVPRADGDAVPT